MFYLSKTYLNYNQLSHEQRNGGIQQMPKTPEEYRSRYNLNPITLDDIQEDIKRFDTQLAQQVMQNSIQSQNNNVNRFQRGGPTRRRGRNRPSFHGQQSFRGRGSFQPQYGQSFNSGMRFIDGIIVSISISMLRPIPTTRILSATISSSK